MSRSGFFIVNLLILPSCAVFSLEQFETEPVRLETPSGLVLCQLYTRALTVWDRSIDRPETMAVDDADAMCEQEGLRRVNR